MENEIEHEVSDADSVEKSAKVSSKSSDSKNFDGLKTGGMILGIVAALGLVSYGVWAVFLGMTPDAVMARFIIASEDLESVAYNAEITYNDKYTREHLEDDEYDEFIDGAKQSREETGVDIEDVILKVSGSMDGAEKDPLKNESQFKIEVFADSEMNNPEISFETRIVDEVIYFNVEDLPSNPVVAMFGLNNFADRWVSVDENDDPFLKKGFNDYRDAIKDANIDSEELEAELKEYYRENPPVVVKEDLGFEDVGGRKSYHYIVELDEDAVMGALKIVEEYDDGNEKIVHGDIEFLEELFDSMKDVPIDIWIDKRSFYLRKIAFESYVDVVVEMYDHNKDIKVEVPEEYTEVLEFFGEVTEAFMKSSGGSSVMGGAFDSGAEVNPLTVE